MVEVFAGMGGLDVGKRSTEDNPGMVNQRDVVTELFGRRHVVCGEDNGGSLFPEPKHLSFKQVGIDRVEPAEGFIKDKKSWFVQHGYNKLHFLLHPLGKFLDTPVPPIGYLQTVKPLVQPLLGSVFVQSFKARQVDGLFAHAHFLIEPAFLGQIPYLLHIRLGHGMTIENNASTVGPYDMVDDTDKGRLAGSVGTDKAEYTTPANMQRHVVERPIGTKSLGNSIYCKHFRNNIVINKINPKQLL